MSGARLRRSRDEEPTPGGSFSGSDAFVPAERAAPLAFAGDVVYDTYLN